MHQNGRELPSHAADLEVTKVRTVFLFRLSGEFGSEELHRRHRRDEVVNVMLREVSAARCADSQVK